LESLLNYLDNYLHTYWLPVSGGNRKGPLSLRLPESIITWRLHYAFATWALRPALEVFAQYVHFHLIYAINLHSAMSNATPFLLQRLLWPANEWKGL